MIRKMAKLVGRWWPALTFGLVFQGWSIKAAYETRGYFAYGGEYLVMPLVILTIAFAENIAAAIKEASDDGRNMEDCE